MKAFMFVVVVAVLALAMNTAMAQTNVAGDVVKVVATIGGAPLTVTAGSQEVDITLNAGVTYRIFYDPVNAVAAIEPNPGAANDVSGFDWEVVADPFTNVVFTFNLPTAFSGETFGYQFPISYGNTDGVFVSGATAPAPSVVWNPRNPSPVVNLSGDDFVYLGCSFSVPVAAPADLYDATFYLSATETGF